MTAGKSWIGDWHARIYERLRARGFDDVTSFAEASPRSSTLALAEELGPEDVNAAQLVALWRDEAERGGSVLRFARSLLVRELHEAIPAGWGIEPDDGFDFAFKVSGPLVTLSTELPEPYQPMARELGRIMMAADLPRGWLPEGPDDPVLLDFFERARAGAPAS